MILINLLPHREEKRKRRQQAFFVGVGMAVVTGAAISGLWFGALQQMISSQQERNSFLVAENAKLDEQIKTVANLRAEIEALKARQKAVEDLQADRNIPVHLLNQLVKQTPEGVYLTSIKQEGMAVLVTGIAQTNERVSEFLRNTSGAHSEWIERPELVEIRLHTPTSSAANKDGQRQFIFDMRLQIKRPQPPGDKASAASTASTTPTKG
jgi:type IV pilus assembly protein PilN